MTVVKPDDLGVLLPPGQKSTSSSGQQSYLLAHLSDPHLTSLHQIPMRMLFNKRVLGYLSWRMRRRNDYKRDVLSALVRDLIARTPDHVVITGDLTHLGLPGEFQEVRQWLPELGSPSQVTLVPGNHDAYVDESWSTTFALWNSYMASDLRQSQKTPVAENSVVFPLLRVRGPLALIGLSSACPTAPGYATGSIGGLQLQRLEQLLVETGKQGLIRIVLIHHPPLPTTVNWRKRLIDGAALRKVLDHRGVELILHGHAHRSILEYLETTIGTVPVIGVASASRIGGAHGAKFNFYRFKADHNGWIMEIITRGYSPDENRFIDCGWRRLTIPLARVPTSR